MAQDNLPTVQAEGPSPIDRGAVASASRQGQALADIGGLVNEQIVTGRTEDFRESLETVVEEETIKTGEEKVVLPNTSGENQASADLRNLMARQRFAMDQGSKSVVDRTTLELKNSLAQARTRWPGMVQELEQEFGSFVRTDPGFDALAILDIDRTQAAAAAKRDYDDVITEAQDLGIDLGTHMPGTTEFASVYLYRSGLKQKIEDNERYEAAVRSVASRRTLDRAEEMRQRIVGARNTAYNELIGVQALVKQRSKFLVTGKSDDLNFSTDYDLFLKQDALDRVDAAVVRLQTEFDNDFSLVERESQTFQTAQTMIDESVEHLNVLKKAIVDDNVTALTQWEAKELVRNSYLREAEPRLAQFDDFVGAFPKIFDPEFMEQTFNKEHTVVQDAISTVLNTDVARWVSDSWVKGGQGMDTSGMSPLAVRRRLRANLNMDPAPYDYPTDNNDHAAQARAGTTNLANMFDNIGHVTDEATPKGAMPFINAIATNIDVLAEQGADQFQEVDDAMMLGAASPNFHKLLEVANDDPNNWTALMSAGDVMQDQYVEGRGGHDGRRDAMAAVVRVGLPGNASAHQLIKLDDAGVGPKGELLYVVDQKAVDTYLANTPEATVNNLGIVAGFRAAGIIPKTRKEALMGKLQPLATELTQKANQNFQVQAAIYKAQNPGVTMSQQNYNDLFSANGYEVLAQIDTSEGESGE